jgi:hypothetical protein
MGLAVTFMASLAMEVKVESDMTLSSSNDCIYWLWRDYVRAGRVIFRMNFAIALLTINKRISLVLISIILYAGGVPTFDLSH